MSCRFLKGGRCILATRVAGRTIKVERSDCNECLPKNPSVSNLTPTIARLVKINPPSILQQAKTYTEAVKEHAATGFSEVPEEVYQERLAICNACDFLVNNQCSLCRCRLAGPNAFLSKLRMRGSACYLPQPKWFPYYNGGPILGTSTPAKSSQPSRTDSKLRSSRNRVIPRPNPGKSILATPRPSPNGSKATPASKPGGLDWAYGVTTVPSRISDLLPRTLESLAKGGFETPRLFVDGATEGFEKFGLEITYRYPALRTAGNWFASLWELYLRNPHADRYAIFQDDFVTYRNLRAYLGKCDYPEKGYLNLYTFPQNQSKDLGWYPAPCKERRGLGAVALVFNREATKLLLTSEYLYRRAQDKKRGHKAIDGGIITALTGFGFKEYTHNPSLVQHTGIVSSMGNGRQALAVSFRGEDFDALELLGSSVANVVESGG